MTNKEIIEFAKEGKNNAKMVLFNEGSLVSYLSGLITVIALENKKIDEESDVISAKYMFKLESDRVKCVDDIDELRIISIKMYLNMEKDLKKLILKYKPELKKNILEYFRDVRFQAYFGEDYDDYSPTLLG